MASICPLTIAYSLARRTYVVHAERSSRSRLFHLRPALGAPVHTQSTNDPTTWATYATARRCLRSPQRSAAYYDSSNLCTANLLGLWWRIRHGHQNKWALRSRSTPVCPRRRTRTTTSSSEVRPSQTDIALFLLLLILSLYPQAALQAVSSRPAYPKTRTLPFCSLSKAPSRTHGPRAYLPSLQTSLQRTAWRRTGGRCPCRMLTTGRSVSCGARL